MNYFCTRVPGEVWEIEFDTSIWETHEIKKGCKKNQKRNWTILSEDSSWRPRLIYITLLHLAMFCSLYFFILPICCAVNWTPWKKLCAHNDFTQIGAVSKNYLPITIVDITIFSYTGFSYKALTHHKLFDTTKVTAIAANGDELVVACGNDLQVFSIM